MIWNTIINYLLWRNNKLLIMKQNLQNRKLKLLVMNRLSRQNKKLEYLKKKVKHNKKRK